jgi:hypothetical protein
VGFVAYHDAIAVNDFRYLARSQTLELDWTDPWYTSFQTRSLRRSYFAPMTGFIYVEPYEVRKEIIVRPSDLQHWIDLGLAGRETIPVEMQEELLRTVGEFLREHHPVLIDGETIVPELARVNFLERTLRSSRVIDPPEELKVSAAILGAIFVYPTEGLPELVTMEWDLFSPRITRVPASTVDQAGPLPTFLEPDYSTLTWQNFLKHPELPTLKALRSPPSSPARWAAWLSWPLAATTVLLIVWAAVTWRRSTARAVRSVVVLVCALATLGAFGFGGRARLSDEVTEEVISGLLHNIYRAFDYREEAQIYDVLEQSVTGDLLRQIYLETQRGLVLANQGGARAKVKQIELVELSVEAAAGGGFDATATWNVSGSVGHWGHVHQRSNRYRAELGIRPEDGSWKLSRMTLLEEERL